MSLDLQTLIAILVVALAATVVGKRLCNRGCTGGEGCSRCSSAGKQGPELVSLKPLKRDTEDPSNLFD